MNTMFGVCEPGRMTKPLPLPLLIRLAFAMTTRDTENPDENRTEAYLKYFHRGLLIFHACLPLRKPYELYVWHPPLAAAMGVSLNALSSSSCANGSMTCDVSESDGFGLSSEQPHNVIVRHNRKNIVFICTPELWRINRHDDTSPYLVIFLCRRIWRRRSLIAPLHKILPISHSLGKHNVKGG